MVTQETTAPRVSIARILAIMHRVSRDAYFKKMIIVPVYTYIYEKEDTVI